MLFGKPPWWHSDAKGWQSSDTGNQGTSRDPGLFTTASVRATDADRCRGRRFAHQSVHQDLDEALPHTGQTPKLA
jgi:hypothetical protein